MAYVWQLYVATSLVVVIIGIYCIASKRNMLKSIIGVEIVTSAVNLNFLAFGSRYGVSDPLAQSMVAVSIAIGACVAAVALSIMVNAYRHYGTMDLRKLRRLRW